MAQSQENQIAELLKQRRLVAQFGELALRSNDLDEILTDACRLIAEALGVELSKVMELQEDRQRLFVRAGVGWKPGVVGEAFVDLDPASSEGYALRSGAPLVSNDIRHESRFQYADFIKDNGVRALVNVPIHRPDGAAYGILQVDSRTPQRFGEEDTDFLRGYANLVGAAIDRLLKTDDLRRAHESLRNNAEVMRHTQKLEAIGQLTGGVAHDFNNLLTIIRSSVDFLRRDDLPEERRRRYVDAISQTVDRASILTRQLLAFARRSPLKPEVFDVGTRIPAVLDFLRPVLGGLVRVEHEVCDSCYAEADASQFETALVNLAVNARDAMGGQGVLTVKAFEVASLPAVRGHKAAPGPFVAISVSDTGKGIDPADVSRIFEPFFTTKGIGEGTGLGLSQVHGFAKQSGGEIDVRSEPGKGATFTLYLPARPGAVRQPEARAEQARAAPEDAQVLVVEDNETVGQMATEMLTDLGYRTYWASNAAAALQILAERKDEIDLVFSDVVMPGIDGVTFAEDLRARYPGLPVVLTSGYSHVLAEQGRHGFELVEKPYSIDALAQVMCRVIQKAGG